MINNYKKPIIIYNPFAAAGISAKKKTVDLYKAILEKANLFESIELYPSKSREDAINKIVAVHNEKKHDLIISVGGDGSLSTICNGLMKIPLEKRLPLFPLPTGTGNSLLRDFKVYTIVDAIKHYKKEEPKLFDVIDVKEINGDMQWYCVNVLGMGFISDIARFVDKNGKKLGHLSYIFGTVLALGQFKPYKVNIKYGDKVFTSDKTFFLTFSNTKYTGGHIKVAPFAKYDDGLMDVVILHDINRFQFLKGFVKISSGAHLKEKGCEFFQTKELVIESDPPLHLMPDGDLFGKSPVKIKVIPGQLRLIV